jgi:hypothetical protein
MARKSRKEKSPVERVGDYLGMKTAGAVWPSERCECVSCVENDGGQSRAISISRSVTPRDKRCRSKESKLSDHFSRCRLPRAPSVRRLAVASGNLKDLRLRALLKAAAVRTLRNEM